MFFYSLGIDQVLSKITTKKFNEKNKEEARVIFDGEYPQFILDAIENRSVMLQRGLPTGYAGVDQETSDQITTIIRNNANNGAYYIANLIRDLVPILSAQRANTIAITEVANAVEESQFLLYSNFGYKQKEWQTVGDKRVRKVHLDNEKQGKIAINANFISGEPRAGYSPYCRCTTLYY